MLANNPQAISSAISAGFRNAPKSNPNKYTTAASNPELANAIGRVAAASLARNSTPLSPKAANNDLRPPPPPVPRRTASDSSFGSAVEPPRVPARTSISSGSLPQREIGKLSNVSRKLWSGQNNDDSPPTPAPATFTPNRKLAPPPRHGTLPPPRARTPTPEPEPEPEEDEEQGEWAEALYDYKSADPNDLQLHGEQRVLITERTSDDWWTAQADGKTGLVPAAYVKLL